ncbi:MAG: BatD family protein, partial [Deltaproteobacteria bacterium]|nr:BatD family protein [Deltaproteobacteria bacterium]
MTKIAATVVLAFGLTLGLGARDALAAPQAAFRLEGKPHVDVPFELTMLIEGFEESPVPALPSLQLPDATVTPLGATPNVARSIQIINGRRVDTLDVTWKLRWRVEAHKEGALRVPATTVVQGTQSVTAQAGDVVVDTIPTTDAMKLSLALPDRPVFVGETVPVELVWLFRQQPDEQSFAVPLMTNDAFTVQTAPVTDKSRALPFTAGAKEIPVPYVADTVDVGGQQWHRIKFTFFVAPRRTGRVEVPASSVIASLAVGRRDFFGNAATRPFRAADVVRTLEVKPLPETNRPPNFAGAVGEQYSIAVHTSRSVVQLGEPVELDITIKSSQRLDTLSLGKLDGPGGLPKDKFTVPPEAPTGELSEDGLSKTFKVTAQVTGPATEIPAITFAYFDPKAGAYETISSDPIAVSVKGGSVVGAESVIAATPRKGAANANTDVELALVNAQLALSSAGDVEERPLTGSLLWVLIGLLYAV